MRYDDNDEDNDDNNETDEEVERNRQERNAPIIERDS